MISTPYKEGKKSQGVVFSDKGLFFGLACDNIIHTGIQQVIEHGREGGAGFISHFLELPAGQLRPDLTQGRNVQGDGHLNIILSGYGHKVEQAFIFEITQEPEDLAVAHRPASCHQVGDLFGSFLLVQEDFR